MNFFSENTIRERYDIIGGVLRRLLDAELTDIRLKTIIDEQVALLSGNSLFNLPMQSVLGVVSPDVSFTVLHVYPSSNQNAHVQFASKYVCRTVLKSHRE